MLHFCPIEPCGQVVSLPPSTVHFCEHTGVGNMLNVFVHTWLAHSVLVSLTAVHAEPNARFVTAGASAGGGESLPHATNHVVIPTAHTTAIRPFNM
jgi:hypothetical protein